MNRKNICTSTTVFTQQGSSSAVRSTPFPIELCAIVLKGSSHYPPKPIARCFFPISFARDCRNQSLSNDKARAFHIRIGAAVQSTGTSNGIVIPITTVRKRQAQCTGKDLTRSKGFSRFLGENGILLIGDVEGSSVERRGRLQKRRL